jgi:outer membrane protein assembly factor BamD (BamD/ComL family)
MYNRSFISRAAAITFAILTFCATAWPQQGPARGRVEEIRDETLEIKANHNLEVARWYLTRRKAYSGAKDRLLEIIEIHPDFSKMDEVLYLLGEAYLKLDKKDDAAENYDKMLKEFPGSQFAKKAREQLDKLKPSDSKK